MYLLSLHLHERGLDVLWMAHTPTVILPVGEYRSYGDLKRFISLVPPPPEYELDHLTYVGSKEQGSNPDILTVSHLNSLASRYAAKGVVVLRDTSKISPDVEFAVPAVGWIPLHSHGRVRNASHDYWVLRAFHGYAALSPSSLRDFEEGMLGDEIGRTVASEHVPHVIDG